VIENFLDSPDIFFGHFEPHTQVSVYSIRDNQLATFFAFKLEKQGIADRQRQFDTLKKAFGNQQWIVPELVDATILSPYFYFDAVAQIKLTPWYKNRVALVGDACQCLTLLAGQGASMAMAGAYLLADELQKANGDYQIAFPAYQAKLKPEIEKRQIEAQKLAGSFVPENQFSIWMMYAFLKMAFLPGFRSIFKRQIGAQSIIH
jgi:2-polyprenyl-6-methoxyphenol hydroxylase-like FAD-dependent oxidoreductase